MIRIVLADDHPGFRAGVRARLDREPDLEVVGEAGSGTEALELAATLRPDVLVLDIEMPGATGVDVLAEIGTADGAPAILVLSGYDDAAYAFAALDRGAAGYLTKHEPLAAVVEAVRGVSTGEMGWLSRRIAAHVQRRGPVAQDAAAAAGLSPRERDVLDLLAQGLRNDAIGEQLFISESTVKKHVHALYGKVGVPTRAAAVAWAWRNGLVEADPKF